ncbi:MAG: site-2 protease family protein [Acidothermus sp.]|nr:site-2 protease family protein [Acidothermus sp.]MCL6537999.1 site-2 protease family protein [Acidothermus sp.]
MTSPAPRTGDATSSGSGLRLGYFFGAPVIVGPSWLLFLAWITWQFAPIVADAVPGIGEGRYLVSASFGVFLGLSVLAHELAHVAVARVVGVPTDRIVLTALAGHSALRREPGRPHQMFAVAVFGPLTNIAIAAAAWAAHRALPPHTVASVLAAGLAWTNGIVGLYNLLPGLPLDGGQMLRSLIWAITRKPRLGVIWGAWSGRIVGGATAFFGAYLLTRDDPQAQLDGLWAMLIAAMLIFSAGTTLRLQALRERLPALSARTLTRQALSVTGDVPLSEAVRRAQEARAGGLVVIDGYGRPTAVVSEAAVVATPESRRPWISVSSVARQISPADLLPADLQGEALLERLRSTPASEYVVVGPDGEIYGVLAAADVAAALRA